MKKKWIPILMFFILLLTYNSCGEENKTTLLPLGSRIVPRNKIPLPPKNKIDSKPVESTRGVPFEFINRSALQTYTGSQTIELDQIEYSRIEISLKKFGSGNYGGEVSVIYYHEDREGREKESEFSSYHPKHQDLSEPSRLFNVELNKWQRFGQEDESYKAWKGFFQDSKGALVLLLKESFGEDFGDGISSYSYFGTFWVKNFPTKAKVPGTLISAPVNPHQGPDKLCWEITAGPYKCRASVHEENGQLYVGSDYTKIGRFKINNIDELGIDEVLEE